MLLAQLNLWCESAPRRVEMDATACKSNAAWESGYPKWHTVCAETIAELVPERADPVILRFFFLALTAFRLIPVLCPARRAKPENCWKR